MDGSNLEILEGVKGKLTKATALAIMGKMNTVISHSYLFSCLFSFKNFYCYTYYCLSQNHHHNLKGYQIRKLISLTVGDKLWWADQGTDQIGTCDKKDGGNWKVLRNNTSPMMHMRIYDEDVQKGKRCDFIIWRKNDSFLFFLQILTFSFLFFTDLLTSL